MTEQERLYDLMIVLSTGVDEERRARLIADVQAQITGAGGSVRLDADWHARPLAYQIAHQDEGEYHLLQFTGPTPLLESLSHSLRIDDAVLRFRIIRVLPGTPPPPEPPPVLAAAAAPQAAGEQPAIER
ncbi:MAG TPA: 30S ribosomal protein S6 [Solirubrobacteraceae bacterium]|nr:30S ribosomal protein S6 [Solirubrobacteraceae bacterium]